MNSIVRSIKENTMIDISIDLKDIDINLLNSNISQTCDLDDQDIDKLFRGSQIEPFNNISEDEMKIIFDNISIPSKTKLNSNELRSVEPARDNVLPGADLIRRARGAGEGVFVPDAAKHHR